MSPRSSDKKKKGGKAKGATAPPDVYVALLFVSLAALLLGCVFLVQELQKYGWQMGP